MSARGRPRGEHRSAKYEATPLSTYLAALRRSAGVDVSPVVPVTGPGTEFDGDPFGAAQSEAVGEFDVQPDALPPPGAAPPSPTQASLHEVPTKIRSPDVMARTSRTVTPVQPEPVEGAVRNSTNPTRPDDPHPHADRPAEGRPPWPAASRQVLSAPQHATVQVALRWVAADPAAAAAMPERGVDHGIEPRPGEAARTRHAVAVEAETDVPTSPPPAAASPARQLVRREATTASAARHAAAPASQALELRIGQLHLHLDATPIAAAPSNAPTVLRPPPTRDFGGQAPSPTRSSLGRARLRRL